MPHPGACLRPGPRRRTRAWRELGCGGVTGGRALRPADPEVTVAARAPGPELDSVLGLHGFPDIRVTGWHEEEASDQIGAQAGTGPRPHARWGGSHEVCPEGIPGLHSGTVTLGCHLKHPPQACLSQSGGGAQMQRWGGWGLTGSPWKHAQRPGPSVSGGRTINRQAGHLPAPVAWRGEQAVPASLCVLFAEPSLRRPCPQAALRAPECSKEGVTLP